MKDKILVTGGTGFIGANLARKLVELNYEVHILTRKTSNKWRLKDIGHRLNEHEVDIEDSKKLKKVIEGINPNIIFHLAVYGGYPYQKDEDTIISTNFLGTINLINACSNVNYKLFINTGTSSEYGPKETRMVESDIVEPINVYGVSKAAAILYCNYIAKTKNKPITTLRLFSPFGYYEDKNRLVPYVIMNCLRDNEIRLGRKNSVRDFIFIEDVINVYLNTINSSTDLSGEIINIGFGEQHSVGEVVSKIIELTGKKVSPLWESIPKRSNEPNVWVADISKAKNFLGWEPRYNMEEGLDKTVKWFMENMTMYDKQQKKDKIR